MAMTSATNTTTTTTATIKGSLLLLVDDDPAVRKAVSGLLRDEGARTVEASDAAAAFRILSGGELPDAVVLDLGLPGESGLELLARLPRPLPAPVVVLSGGATAAEAVRAIQLGATDFVEKPPSAERLLTALGNALSLRALEDERARLLSERERLVEDLSRPGHLVGQSTAMQELRALVARIGPSDASVLLQGETGAGKERVARALHQASGRAGRFVAINCAALPEALLESELFGHERGAFTGANARRLGRFEQADKGTLLLDELGELVLGLQAKLLRVLETREVERLGGTRPVKVDVRLLAATHHDLGKLVAEGKFRQDLYYRLAVMPLAVPPLRARPEDLKPLLLAFAAELAPALEVILLSEGEQALRDWSWPGNVRELRNLAERVLLMREPGPTLRLGAELSQLLGGPLPARTPAAPPPIELGHASLREILETHERGVLRQALERSAGNVAGAARLLQVDRGNLWRRLKALGLSTDPSEEAP